MRAGICAAKQIGHKNIVKLFINKTLEIIMYKKMLCVAVLLLFVVKIRADEGMWIPLLLEKYTIQDMQKKGFKLSAEDIYSVNKASLKDAIAIFGRGCTSGIISKEGLLITNHHCGYSQIQSHSSVEHDYLTNGFWAMTRDEELVNKGLSVRFLIRMADITQRVVKSLHDQMTESIRQNKIDSVVSVIESEVSDTSHYKVAVKPFYFGNEFYMFIYEEFTDVRLVGAPPSAIGKFGGDTDNWMWPRHTGDFSVFRVYMSPDSLPADYSPDNIPYIPRKHLKISLKGVEKGDFTMVFGFPGRTQQYLTSYGVKLISQIENPHQIRIRQKKIDIMSEAMENDPKVRIQYASKYARVSNYWKKWIGENRGLRRLHALDKKRALEDNLKQWIAADEMRKKKYGGILKEYKILYEQIAPYALAADYFFEANYTLDIMQLASRFTPLANSGTMPTEKETEKIIENLHQTADDFFKDYHKPTDKKIFAAMLQLYAQYLDSTFQPEIISRVRKVYNGDFEQFTEDIYSTSFLTNKEKVHEFLEAFTSDSIQRITNDPFYLIYQSGLTSYLYTIRPEYNELNSKIDSLNRIYIRALKEYQTDKRFYPDANSTMRIAYGMVDGYEPSDGVVYEYYTTLQGVIEKDNPEIYDYRVPEKLKKIYEAKDFGQYADEEGKVRVCFIATNHTTGGNSGSPVLDANGNLVGLNFDRNWEGTMSDIMYHPDLCRNITLDMRYALFIIDKYAGAKHLIDEMTIVD